MTSRIALTVTAAVAVLGAALTMASPAKAEANPAYGVHPRAGGYYGQPYVAQRPPHRHYAPPVYVAPRPYYAPPVYVPPPVVAPYYGPPRRHWRRPHHPHWGGPVYPGYGW